MLRTVLLVCLSGAAWHALGSAPEDAGHGIPKQLWGKWVIHRQISTRTIACWGDKEARKLIGTEIEYKPDSFRWKNVVTDKPSATKKTVTAQEFQKENSGGGANDSQVSFKDLGILQPAADLILIQHPDAHITTATTEIPGDSVLVKSEKKIVFSVCNVYFEADRAAN
jgi:hypothetical protein